MPQNVTYNRDFDIQKFDLKDIDSIYEETRFNSN